MLEWGFPQRVQVETLSLWNCFLCLLLQPWDCRWSHGQDISLLPTVDLQSFLTQPPPSKHTPVDWYCVPWPLRVYISHTGPQITSSPVWLQPASLLDHRTADNATFCQTKSYSCNLNSACMTIAKQFPKLDQMFMSHRYTDIHSCHLKSLVDCLSF